MPPNMIQQLKAVTLPHGLTLYDLLLGSAGRAGLHARRGVYMVLSAWLGGVPTAAGLAAAVARHASFLRPAEGVERIEAYAGRVNGAEEQDDREASERNLGGRFHPEHLDGMRAAPEMAQRAIDRGGDAKVREKLKWWTYANIEKAKAQALSLRRGFGRGFRSAQQ